MKGEGSWGHERNALVLDGIEDIIRKYLDMRVMKLKAAGRTSSAMFPPLRSDSEFYCQQAFGRLKAKVEEVLGYRFELRSCRRAFGQRILDKGGRIEDVSVALGHASTKATELYYARGEESTVFGRIRSLDNVKEVS